MGNTKQPAKVAEYVTLGEMYKAIHNITSDFECLRKIAAENSNWKMFTVKDIRFLNKIHKAIEEYEK